MLIKALRITACKKQFKRNGSLALFLGFERPKALLCNKMIRLDQVILLAYKAKNADIALAKASIFNVVGEQKNTYKWSDYYITEPKVKISTALFFTGKLLERA